MLVIEMLEIEQLRLQVGPVPKYRAVQAFSAKGPDEPLFKRLRMSVQLRRMAVLRFDVSG
jgi:hypothetical protein